MDSTLSGLTEVTTPSPTDLLYIVSGGADKKVQLANLTPGLPVASQVQKGLQSAADKTALDNVVADVATLKSPLTATVASAASIAIPSNTYRVVLTGTTTVTVLVGLENYRTYTFFYPAGAGLTFMGLNMQAGDVYQFVQTP